MPPLNTSKTGRTTFEQDTISISVIVRAGKEKLIKVLLNGMIHIYFTIAKVRANTQELSLHHYHLINIYKRRHKII